MFSKLCLGTGIVLVLLTQAGCSAPTAPLAQVSTPTATPFPISTATHSAPTAVPTSPPTPTLPQATAAPTGRSNPSATTPAPGSPLLATTTRGPAPRATVAPVITSSLRFSFGSPIAPLGDPKVNGLAVDPADGNVWYVNGDNGLYITRDGGNSWTANKDIVSQAVAISPQDSNQVYAGVKETLYLSGDKGRTWKAIGRFDTGTSIRSIHIALDGTLMVGLHWADARKPGGSSEGIYLSRDRGASWQLASFGAPPQGLIVWAIAQDPRDGTLYAGTEIYNHPQPYKPPFFRSKDGGKTWDEISGIMNWHVVAIQISPVDGYVYALTEGLGLFGSADRGDHWKLLSGNIALDLLLDPRHPNRLYGTAFANVQGQYGGLFLSTNGGSRFEQIGLAGQTITRLALNGDGTVLFMAIPNTGIVTTRLPPLP